jgi:hypothetical protein
MKARALFEKLGFQEDWEAITDKRPAYFYDFGNLRLRAAEVMSECLTIVASTEFRRGLQSL